MFKNKIFYWLTIVSLNLCYVSCKVPGVIEPKHHVVLPASYKNSDDTVNIAGLKWRQFFTDPYLIALIDTALHNNQELQITLQELEIAKNEARITKNYLYPKVGAKIGGGIEKVGRYTSQGAGDASTEIIGGKEMPDPLGDIVVTATANWEVDIWKKLRNEKKAAINRYLATVEGKNFVLSSLIAEVANSYYELLALDNQLDIIRQNIEVQNNAFNIVKAQKAAGKATELAVQKFNAEVLNTKGLEFNVQQQIIETENRINLLVGKYVQQHIPRAKERLVTAVFDVASNGVSAQLLANRPDVLQAEKELEAARLDVKAARAEFYPSLGISVGIGLQAFKPSYLFKVPESVLYSIAGDLAGPLINRAAIKAEFANANAKQIQALYNYERVILNAFIEVSNRLSAISNLEKSYALKAEEVDVLTKSITTSNELFKSARADYFEVLMTQRDALEAKLELIETRKNQLSAFVNVYRALGGGWK